jgi:hypothetical protein
MSFDPYITFSIAKESVSREDYVYEHDPVVHVQTALFGLMYWYATHRPQKPLPELPDSMKGKLTVFDMGQKCIDDAPTLFTAAIAACERTWNKNPFSGYDDPQYEDPQYDEENALIFLKWLRENGDIMKLKIKGVEYEDGSD